MTQTCNNCNRLIVRTGGLLYPWTHLDPGQTRCLIAEPKPECYSCGRVPAPNAITGNDVCPTDRGDEIRTFTTYYCDECVPSEAAA